MAQSSKQGKEREQRLHIPLSDEEKTDVRVRAAREDKSMAAYVRDQLFGETESVPA